MNANRAQIILPHITLYLGSQSLSNIARASLIGLRVHQRLSMPAQCELSFVEAADPNEQSELVELLKPGLAVSVSVPGQDDALFEGELTAIEYVYGEGSKLEIFARGYDFLYQLRQRQDVVAYAQTTLAGLARQMLKALPVQRDIVLPPGPSLTWPLLIQHQQTNLEFLVELAAQEGRYLWVNGNQLNLLSLAGLPGDPLPLSLGDNLLTAQLEVNTGEACDEVEVVGWSAELAAVQRQVARRPDRPGDRRLGGQIRRRALLNESAQSAGQAMSLAQAELDRCRLGETSLWGKAAGDPRLHPGAQVDVREVAAPVTGRYVITEAIHSLDFQTGYVTEISTLTPEIRSRPRSDIATVGEVIDINDPRGLGRVRVALPAYGRVQTSWLPLVFPGGGRKKGFVSLPDVKDSVLVLLLREDPAEGIVLGGLYGLESPPESEIAQGRARRYTWTTSKGQKIQINEQGDLVRLETQAGASIELNGSRIVIQGSKIDFKSL